MEPLSHGHWESIYLVFSFNVFICMNSRKWSSITANKFISCILKWQLHCPLKMRITRSIQTAYCNRRTDIKVSAITRVAWITGCCETWHPSQHLKCFLLPFDVRSTVSEIRKEISYKLLLYVYRVLIWDKDDHTWRPRPDFLIGWVLMRCKLDHVSDSWW